MKGDQGEENHHRRRSEQVSKCQLGTSCIEVYEIQAHAPLVWCFSTRTMLGDRWSLELQNLKFHGFLLGVQPNKDGSLGCVQDVIHVKPQELLL